MPTEQTLRAKRLGAPGAGRAADASLAWRARLEQTAASIAPVLLIVGLALAGGGFEVGERHAAGLAVWLVVVGLLVLGAASAATLARPVYWGAGLIGGLALLSALSSLWSSSTELSVIEADRILVYLGFFLAAFLIAQTNERRQRFAEGLAIAVALVALLGLGSRLLPHVLNVGNSLGSGSRLLYPLGYWNANGAICGIAVAMLLWTSRQATSNALRWLSVAAIPAVLLTLYFTFSRGGLLALLVACGCLLVLSRDRLWLLATLAIGALGALPALLATQARDSLTENVASQTTVDQGEAVFFILLGGIALALLLFAGLRRLESRGGGLTGKALTLSRDRTLLRRLALLGAVVAIGAAIAVGGRAWDQFTTSDVQLSSQQQRFTDFSGTGRSEFWRVAIDAFGEKPLLGHGAGTYQFSWAEHRSIDAPVHNAHSLYLEAFAELGLIGGILVVALVAALLWFGFCAWRGAAPSERDRYAALLAAMLAFAIGAGIDWFWEIAALGAVFFLAAGVLVAARCAQLAKAPRRGGEGTFGLVVGGLAVAWVAAIALIGPLLVDHEIKASQSAAAGGDLTSAVNHAKNARSIEPFASSPYVQLGLLAELQRDYPTAVTYLSDAIEREANNWQLYYLRSRVEHEEGDGTRARADFAEAQRLNPLENCLQREEWRCGE
jgi:O-antigen ligase/polysaccharide polymerase Wzy-like membrane protein